MSGDQHTSGDQHRSSDSRVRPARPEDAPVLAQLRLEFRAALEPLNEPTDSFLERCEAWMKARLADADAWRCWVATTEAGIVGAIWLHFLEKIPNPVDEPEWHGYVSNLYVVPAARGRGLGEALLAQTIRACEQRGVDEVVLWPTPETSGLYERHGFAARDDVLVLRVAV